MADVERKEPSALVRRLQAIGDRIQRMKPVRVFMHYTARRGPILAAGLSYQAIFSVFAAVLGRVLGRRARASARTPSCATGCST